MVNLIPADISPYRIVYYGCRISGLLNDKGRPWSLIYTGYHWFIIYSWGITSILEICFGNGNLQSIIEALSAFTIFVQIWSKSLNYALNGRKIRDLLERLESIRTVMLKDEENKHYITEADKRGRKYITVLAIAFLTCPFLSFFSTTVYDYLSNFQNKRLFFRVWIPWSTEEVGPYIAAKIFAALMALSGVMTYTTFGMFEFTFTFQMSAYLKILQHCLKTRGPKDKMVYEQHKTLIELISGYNRLFSGQIYLETVVSSLMPCGFILTIIRAVRRYEFNQFDKIQTLILLLSAPCIVCFCGQELSTEVEKLHESSYMSDWYEQTPKVRKDLLMLMMRTTHPTKMDFKKFVTFDHVCLARVMQGLYSYIMMIVNFDSL